MTAPRPKQPNPGSDEALAQGCRCPVLDNARGKGMRCTSKAEPSFWISGDCPLHGLGVRDRSAPRGEEG